MRNKKTTALLLSILLLSGCTYQYDNKASTDVEYKFEKEKEYLSTLLVILAAKYSQVRNLIELLHQR